MESSNSRSLILCCNVFSVARRCRMLFRDRCEGVIMAATVGRSGLGSSTRRSKSMVRSDAGSAEDDRLEFLVFMFVLLCNSLTTDD